MQALKSLCARVGSGVDAEDSECLQALTRFVGDILSGKVPLEVMVVWASARLLPYRRRMGSRGQ